MDSSIRILAEFTVTDGKMDTFKRVLAEVMDTVRGRDTGTLSYDLFLAETDGICFSLEHYRDSQAVLEHLTNVSEVGARLFTVCTTTRLEILGHPSEEVLRALSSSHPQVLEHHAGL